MNRESSVEQWMRQFREAIGDKRTMNESKEVCKLLQKIKEDAPMHDLDRVKQTNKELVTKVSCLEEKCMNLEKKLEVEREKNRAFEEEMLKAEQKLEKVEVEREELMERIASMEKLEVETMFGNEDDTVFVDFDQLVENF